MKDQRINYGQLEQELGKASSKTIIKTLGNILKKTATLIGMPIIGYSIDKATGGEGYIGMAAGGLVLLTSKALKEYAGILSGSITNELIRDYKRRNKRNE